MHALIRLIIDAYTGTYALQGNLIQHWLCACITDHLAEVAWADDDLIAFSESMDLVQLGFLTRGHNGIYTQSDTLS